MKLLSNNIIQYFSTYTPTVVSIFSTCLPTSLIFHNPYYSIYFFLLAIPTLTFPAPKSPSAHTHHAIQRSYIQYLRPYRSRHFPRPPSLCHHYIRNPRTSLLPHPPPKRLQAASIPAWVMKLTTLTWYFTPAHQEITERSYPPHLHPECNFSNGTETQPIE